MALILETERLQLRPLTGGDRAELCEILQDKETMYAYAHAFSEKEVDEWLARQLGRYETDGFGLWAVERKDTGAFVGQVGITMQDWDKQRVPEIGYLLKRRDWHLGYATEAAMGCRNYAFETLGMPEICSIIRDNNLPSQAVARRVGMQVAGHLVKHYYGLILLHDVYRITREEWLALEGT